MTTMTIPEVMTRQATVEVATLQEGRNGAPPFWALRLIVKDISDYSFPCFWSAETTPQIFKDSVHVVTLRRGKQKQGKAGGDGKVAFNYQWDLTRWDVQAAPAQTPAASRPERDATEKPQMAAPPAPVPWDAADTQSRISWAQAVNLAVEIGSKYRQGDGNDSETPISYLANVEFWANHFYPLIRKGPSPQNDLIDPESLPFDEEPWDEDPKVGRTPPHPLIKQPAHGGRQDAPQPHQGATDGAPVPADDSQAQVEFPPRKKDEVDYTYYFRCGRVVGLDPPQSLKRLGVSNWGKWIEAGHTLEEALEKLKGWPWLTQSLLSLR